MNSAIIFFFAAVSSYALAFPVAQLLRRFNVIDQPNVRSSHLRPTLRGGGIAILTVLLIGFVFIGFWKGRFLLFTFAGAALLLAMVSFLDDLRPVPARVRFATHSFVALLCLGSLWSSGRFPLLFGNSLLNVLLVVALFFWIVGYTNAFNFMDGINGIAVGQVLITGLGTALILGLATGDWHHPLLLCSLVLAGAALGFLPHNFPRARMFMGDVGSAPLGFLLASLAVAVAKEFGWYLLIPLFLLHINYIGDTSITLIRRFLRGERVYEAHKEHFYQRLVRAGKSHPFVTGWEMALQCVTLALALVYVNAAARSFRIGLVLLVVFTWSLFFVYAEISFQRTTQRQSDSIATLSASTGEKAG